MLIQLSLRPQVEKGAKRQDLENRRVESKQDELKDNHVYNVFTILHLLHLL